MSYRDDDKYKKKHHHKCDDCDSDYEHMEEHCKEHEHECKEHPKPMPWMMPGMPCMMPRPVMPRPMVVYHYHYIINPMWKPSPMPMPMPMPPVPVPPIPTPTPPVPPIPVPPIPTPPVPPALTPGCTWYTVRPGDSMYDIALMFNVPLAALIAANPQISNPSLIYPGQQICIPATPTDVVAGISAPGTMPAQPMPLPMPMPMPMPMPATPVYPMTPAVPEPMPMPLPQPLPLAPVFPVTPIPVPVTPPVPPVPVPPTVVAPIMDEMPAAPAECMWYTVKAGDTMYLIARRHNISLDTLIAANPQISNPSLIYPGQQICIPTGTPGPGPCPNPYTIKAGDTMYLIAQANNVSLDALIAANPHIQNPAVIYPGQVICIPTGTVPAMDIVAGIEDIGISDLMDGMNG